MKRFFWFLLWGLLPLSAHAGGEDFPTPLTAEHKAGLAQAFVLAAQGDRTGAVQAVDAVDAFSPLRGHVEIEALQHRLLLPGDTALLADWLVRYPDHPQAPWALSKARALQKVQSSGGRQESAPPLPQPLPSTPPPVRPNGEISDHQADRNATLAAPALAALLRPALLKERPAEAERLWLSTTDGMQRARDHWAGRIAWHYYLQADDASALRMATQGALGSGPEAANAAWVGGLAAWRQEDCATAARLFDSVGDKKATPPSLVAAAAYWAARAHMACGTVEQVSERLRQAAQLPDSFYGLLAQDALGLSPRRVGGESRLNAADWARLRAYPATTRAILLASIGQRTLAEQELRLLWGRATPADYEPLLRLSGWLTLPATQYWLAHRPPPGQSAPLFARLPRPDWTPLHGWRIDRDLVYAFALQESAFVTQAVSRAGARGILQLMPGTASAMGRARTVPTSLESLSDPATNLELGQAYLETLRDLTGITQGLLPKVVAAYNAGPGAVQRWNASLNDRGDPLLFIESIPFRETRTYVEAVLRNYWLYQELRETGPGTKALTANLWPRFPGLSGPAAVLGTPKPPPLKVTPPPLLPLKEPEGA